MGARLPAAAMIVLLAAAFARAQNGADSSAAPKDAKAKTEARAEASGGPDGQDGPKASAPTESVQELQKGTVESGAVKKSGSFLQETFVKGKGDDVQEAALLEKKLAPNAAGDALKAPLDAASGATAGGPPAAATARKVPQGDGATRTVTTAAAAANAAAAPAASARNGRAMRRANTAAAAMRGTLPSADNSGLNSGAGPAAANLTPRPPAANFLDGGSPSGTSLRPSGPNPTEPRTASDVVLASQTGFASAIRNEGFKIGPGPGGAPAVLASDGRPATPAEISRLSEVLRAEPAALMRRPDFFAVLPRSHFEELKADYRANPSALGAAFQDIGMSAGGRDFRWSASCSGLSGGCNPVVHDPSYRKGADVSPEDLDEVWKETVAAGKDGDDEMGDYTDEDRKEIADAELADQRMKGGRRTGPSLAGLLAGLGSMAEDARDFAGFGGTSVSGPAGSPEAADAGSGLPGGGARSSASLAAGEARGLRAWTVPSPQIERKARRRGAAGALVGLAAAGLILWRRRRSS